MKRVPQFLAALCVAATCAAPAAFAAAEPAKPAQPAAQAHDGKGKGPGKHGRKAFETVDADKSGGITVAELKAAWAQNPRRAERADKIFGFLDQNKDNKIDKAEWDARKKWGGKKRWHRGEGEN